MTPVPTLSPAASASLWRRFALPLCVFATLIGFALYVRVSSPTVPPPVAAAPKPIVVSTAAVEQKIDVQAARIVEAILASQRDVLAAMPRQTPPPDVPAMPAPVAPQTLLPPPPKATSAAKSKPKVASVSPPAATPAAPAGLPAPSPAAAPSPQTPTEPIPAALPPPPPPPKAPAVADWRRSLNDDPAR